MTPANWDSKVRIVDDEGQADLSVLVVGDQVLDLSEVPVVGNTVVWDGSQWVPGPPGPAPIVVTKGDGNLTLTGTGAGNYIDIDSSGSAAARNLDVVIPNVAAGQWITYQPRFILNNEAPLHSFRAYTVVAGARVSFFPAGVIWGGLFASAYDRIDTLVSYQLVSGDIENGAVRIRLTFTGGNTLVRTILAASGLTFVAEGRGPLG